MNHSHIKETLAKLSQEIELITDKKIQAIQTTLLNLVECHISETDKLRKENQKLRDEINRLKGEQGKPSIRKQTHGGKDHSSEKNRKPRGQQEPKKSKKKKPKIKVDRTEVCEVDKATLPDDARFKGYQTVLVQDIHITTENTEFKKKVYYSPSLKKTFIAGLPAGYDGEFGPKLKALVIDLHQHHKMTESAIHEFVRNHNILISQATISRFITDNKDVFHQEKKDIVEAGLASSDCQQMDDTGAKVKGVNHYVHILCNTLYTAFFTRRSKNRLTVIDILAQGSMGFAFNEASLTLMEKMHLPRKQLDWLKSYKLKDQMNSDEVDALLLKRFPNHKKDCNNKRIILEASAIIAYQQSPQAATVLLTDDAPQFKQITKSSAACWVHDGRHYKKLSPVFLIHRKLLDNFVTKYWDYYHALLDYKKHPSEMDAEKLEQEFDRLFSTTTGYQQLDERIEKTKQKKSELLLVLKHPDLPLHNNTSELGARFQARYRDISFHTINEKGTEAKDTFMTIISTAKKLSVNTYQYILDRVSKKYEMPSLASLINARCQRHHSAHDEMICPDF